MKKGIMSCVMLASLTLPVLVGCNQNPTTNEGEGEQTSQAFTVKDVKGRELSFDKPAERAICLGAGALRIYSYVGDMNKLVAVEDYDKPNDEKNLRPYQYAYETILKGLPSAGPGGPGEPVYAEETLVRLQPDVIFTCDKADASFLDTIETKTGAVVCGIDYGQSHVFDTSKENNPFKTSLECIAKIMGTEEKFNAFTTYTDGLVTELNNATKDIATKKNVYMGGVGKKKKFGLHCSTKNNPVLNSINVTNIVDSVGDKISGFNEVDLEFLARQNPDMVFIDQGGLSAVRTQLTTAGQKETYAGWEALTNNNTHVLLPYGDYNTQTDCGLLNAAYIGKVCYPEAFADKSVETMQQEIFSHFYGENVLFSGWMTRNNLTDVCFKTISFAE